MRVLRDFEPQRILAVHSPLHCINYDGPAERLARRMATASGYPLRASIGYPTTGSLGSYAGLDLAIPTITLELRGNTTADDEWRSLRRALEIFVEYGGATDPGTSSTPTTRPRRIR